MPRITRREFGALTAVALTALVMGATAASSAQAPQPEDVLPKVAAYVSDYIPRMASLVAMETFEQRLRVPGSLGSLIGGREGSAIWRLKSDVLLVQDPTMPGDLMLFRDVSEVDGTIVKHGPDRLIELFATPGPDTAARAAAIARESARYHLPGASNAVTNPLLVIALMQARYQPRLRIDVGGEERSLGAGVRILKFEERDGTPPIITGLGPVRGSVWVEPASGRIVKTEARIGDAPYTSTTVTTFARNERLALLVPGEMRTTWAHRQTPGGRSLGQVLGIAKYSGFRRFGVRTESSIVDQR
jgi:hypothetical protein